MIKVAWAFTQIQFASYFVSNAVIGNTVNCYGQTVRECVGDLFLSPSYGITGLFSRVSQLAKRPHEVTLGMLLGLCLGVPIYSNSRSAGNTKEISADISFFFQCNHSEVFHVASGSSNKNGGEKSPKQSRSVIYDLCIANGVRSLCVVLVLRISASMVLRVLVCTEYCHFGCGLGIVGIELGQQEEPS